jgi:hypothetical protein
MDPKLVKQFYFFIIVLFVWTAVILAIGPK